MRIRLHRVVHAGDGAQGAQRLRGARDHLQIVDVGGLLLGERREQLRTLGAPPGRGRSLARRRLREQLLPGGSEHLVARHGADEQFVELSDQAAALVLIDDEREVQIVGRLADQVDLLFLEELERAAELVQDRADVAPDQAHRGARADHLYAAQPREVGDQLGDARVVEGVGRRIQRHRDVGLGGGHEIHRHAVLLEDLEGIRQKTHLMPHARALERNERDALLGADRLHLCAAVGPFGAEHRAFELRRLRGVDVQRDAVLACRQDAARMQHLRAAGGDLLCLIVVQRAQQPCGWGGARIGAEQARHVGPDLQPLGTQLRGQIGGGGVRAAAPEQHGVAIFVAGDEALRKHDRRERRKPPLERRVGGEAAHHRQHARPGTAAGALRAQHGARIRPGDIQTARAQEARAECGGHEFPARHDAGAGALAHLAHEGDACGDFAQLCDVALDLLAQGHGEFGGKAAVAFLDRAQLLLLRLSDRSIEQPLEPIGDTAERRVHDEHARPARTPRRDDGCDVVPVGESRDAGTAEFQDDPGRGRGHLRSLSRRWAAPERAGDRAPRRHCISAGAYRTRAFSKARRRNL